MDKQMDMFGKQGGLYDEGGEVDKESGNDVPVGSLKEEVRDDIPAMLSEGEFVLPADVVRYHGLEKIMMLRDEAKFGLKKMEAMGQMGNADEATLPDDVPFSMEDLVIVVGPDEEQEKPQKKNEGGVIHAQAGSFIAPTQPAGTFTAPTQTQSNMGLAGFQQSMYGQPQQFGAPSPTITPLAPASSIAPPPPVAPPVGGYTPPTVLAEQVDRPEFVPDVSDQYKPVKYINPTTGETMMINEYQGNPVSAVPAGFIRYDDYIASGGEDPTTDVGDTGIDTSVETTQVTQAAGGGDDDSGEKKKLDDLKRETEKVRIEKYRTTLESGSTDDILNEYKKSQTGRVFSAALGPLSIPANLLIGREQKKIEEAYLAAAARENIDPETAKKNLEEASVLASAKDTLSGFTDGITSAFKPVDDPDNFYNQYEAKYDLKSYANVEGFTKDAAGNPTGNLTVKQQQAFDNAVDRGDSAVTNHFALVAKSNAAKDQFAIDNADKIKAIQNAENAKNPELVAKLTADLKSTANTQFGNMTLGESSIDQVIKYGSSVNTAINNGKAEQGGFLKPAVVKDNTPITSKTDSSSKKSTASKPSKDKSKNIASSGRSEKDIQKEINKKIKDATDASGNVNWVKADVGDLVKERDSARKNEGTKTTTQSSSKKSSGGSKPTPAKASGGGCFLTTAIVDRRGEADNGPTLTKLRNFRDTYMASSPSDIEEYYRIAPQIVAAIPKNHKDWNWIGSQVDKSVNFIDNNNLKGAYKTYKAMVKRLEKDWL